MDVLLLSRIQFGFTIAFHILFPTLTIGLAWFLVFFEAAGRRSGRPEWFNLYRFWVKIFALTFGMGVVSGLVLSYEIGTNFSRFSQIAGPVIGPLLSAEVLTAFFVEAGFLGIMLFGWEKVGPRFHFMATLLVAVGTTNSAFWILSANSWMQTPAGAAWQNGQLVPQDWFAVIFNPSFPYRLAHMLLAALLTSSLIVAGISAWFLARQRHLDFAARGLKVAVLAIAVLAPLQIFAGDLHGLEVRHNQPAKLAAIESLWQTRSDVPLVVFAWPDQAVQRNRFAIEIPQLGSLILTHTLHGEVQGLNEFPADRQPPVAPVFFAFRIMVALGFWFLLLGWGSVGLLRGERLLRQPFALKLLTWSAPLGWLATICGWIVAESGRQPWVVYGLLRTADASSPLPLASVALSLATFVCVYGILFSSYLWFMSRLVRSGPSLPQRHPEAIRGARPGAVL